MGVEGACRTAQFKQRKMSVQSSSALVPEGGERIDPECVLPTHTFNL